MRMKKIMALFLTAAMAAGVLSGCGGGNSQTTDNTSADGTSSVETTSAVKNGKDGRTTIRFAWWGGQFD